jgi:hypothetical protein
MKNLGRAITIVGVLAGVSTACATMMIGCSGDNNPNDGGPDSQADTTNDVKSDVIITPDASDSGDAGDAGDGGDPISAFQMNLAKAFCGRFQSCCNGLDAGLGTFDYNKCVSQATASAYNGSGSEWNNAEIQKRGFVTLNSTAAASCIADMATLSCPAVTSSEVTTATANCYAAMIGTLNPGQGCVDSIECKQGNYCKFAGADGGKSDAGTQLGQCATLVAQGQPCGQAPPYGDPTFASNECEYKGWQPPANFCDYDSFPDAGGYTCQPLRANTSSCFNDDECQSGICGTLGQDCVNTICTCNVTRDFTPFCAQLGIKDAGPG